MIAQAWQQYMVELQKASPLGVAALRPGASEGQLRAAETVLGFTLPDEVRELYRMHDGAEPVEEDCPVAFAVCFFIPLLGDVDSAVAEARACSPGDIGATLPDPDYGKTLLPFAKDFGGNLLLVQCRGEDASVWRFDHGNGVPLLRIATHLAEFLDKERGYLRQGLDLDYLMNYDDDYRDRSA